MNADSIFRIMSFSPHLKLITSFSYFIIIVGRNTMEKVSCLHNMQVGVHFER